MHVLYLGYTYIEPAKLKVVTRKNRKGDYMKTIKSCNPANYFYRKASKTQEIKCFILIYIRHNPGL